MAKKYTYQILKQFSPRIYKKSRWEGVGLGCPSVARRRRSRSRRGITPRPARAGRWGSWLPPVNPANEENKCARGRLTATKCDSLISALFIKHTLFRIFTSQFFFNEPWLRPRGWWCCRMRDVAFFLCYYSRYYLSYWNIILRIKRIKMVWHFIEEKKIEIKINK